MDNSATQTPADTPQTTSPASREALWKLWHLLLDTIYRYLQDTPPEKRRAAMLELARSFLRDNGIQIDGRSVQELAKDAAALKDLKMPFGSH